MSTTKQTRQKTIGISPLDHYLSMHQVTQQEVTQQEVTQHEQIIQENTRESTRVKTEESLEQIIQEPQEQQIVLQEVTQNIGLKSIPEQDQHVVQNVVQTTGIQNTDDIIAQMLQSEDMQGPKQRITLHICQEVLDKVKNAVFWEPGLTLAGFAHYALEKAVEQLEHERGAPFPDRKTRRLRSGRPLK